MVYRRAGKTFDAAVGTRAQVVNGTAHHTSGGLARGDLRKNPHGKIVSKRASDNAKKNGLDRLARAGYLPFAKGAAGVVRRR
jgi:hypothetical protein